MLTSDSPTQKKIDVQGFEDDHCFVSDDGICSFSYSDHCSYLELVQFLEFLPCVPVTFVTPLSEAEGPYNYVGATGLKQLMQDTGIPSVRHCRKGEKMDMLKNHLAPKRPVEAAENGGGWDEVWMRCLDRAVIGLCAWHRAMNPWFRKMPQGQSCLGFSWWILDILEELKSSMLWECRYSLASRICRLHSHLICM